MNILHISYSKMVKWAENEMRLAMEKMIVDVDFDINADQL